MTKLVFLVIGIWKAVGIIYVLVDSVMPPGRLNKENSMFVKWVRSFVLLPWTVLRKIASLFWKYL